MNIGVKRGPMHKKALALGHLKTGEMNKTEAAYASLLGTLKSAGDLIWYSFEGMKFNIGKRCWYTPDFMVLTKDHVLQAHEVKGYWMEDARVKIKAAAKMYPIEFIAVKKKGKHFETEHF